MPLLQSTLHAAVKSGEACRAAQMHGTLCKEIAKRTITTKSNLNGHLTPIPDKDFTRCNGTLND